MNGINISRLRYSFIIIFFIRMDKEQCGFIDDYKLHGLLGDGGQANVYLVSKNSQLYAAKVYFSGFSKLQSFKKQVDFLKNLNFKHLINLVGSNIEGKVQLPGKQIAIHPVIYLQFAEGGQLFEYISKQGRFTPEITRSLGKMLISAIEYLQSVGVTHRDLKPQNILFDGQYNLKVSDFGLSTMLEGHDGDGILYTKLGTQGYKPPEMELGKYTGLQADLFAAGVIIFVMYTGTPPFLSTKPTDKIYRLIRQKQYPKFWALHEKKKPAGFFSDAFKRLINSFFSAQVDKRPTIESLKEDEFLNGDESLQDQIYNEMKARYNKILQTDENKQKIEKAKLQMTITQMSCMEQQKCEQSENEQMQEGEKHRKYHKPQSRQDDKLYKVDIKPEDLTLSEKTQLIPTKVAPSIVVAWLQSYIRNAFQTNNIFLKEPLFETLPLNYNFNFDEQEKCLRISLDFKIDDQSANFQQEDSSQTIEQVYIQGSLVKLPNGCISIDWKNGRGNAFWISSLLGQLNTELKILS